MIINQIQILATSSILLQNKLDAQIQYVQKDITKAGKERTTYPSQKKDVLTK